jgi:hypothetical protein
MAVDVEDEAVVGADADGVGGGDGGQGEGAAEVEHERLAERGGGMGDPGGIPLAVGRVRLDGVLGLYCEGGEDEGE